MRNIWDAVSLGVTIINRTVPLLENLKIVVRRTQKLRKNVAMQTIFKWLETAFWFCFEKSCQRKITKLYEVLLTYEHTRLRYCI